MAAHINMGINIGMKAGLVWPSVSAPCPPVAWLEYD
jgi:hypothetical protein